MGRSKQINAAGAKGQAVISKFFAPKTTTVTGSVSAVRRAQKSPSSSNCYSPSGTVAWPLAQSPSLLPSKRKHSAEHEDDTAEAQEEYDVREQSVSPQKHCKLFKLESEGIDKESESRLFNSELTFEETVYKNEASPSTPVSEFEKHIDSFKLQGKSIKRKRSDESSTGNQRQQASTLEKLANHTSAKKQCLGKDVKHILKGATTFVEQIPKIIDARMPRSDPTKHQMFIEKLLNVPDGHVDARPGKSIGNERYTPLEQQVSDLKAKYPDVVLMVEVGYRYRFFGNDAEIAARVLGVIAYHDHSFLTASVPTFRLNVHVRRLVEAGYKVGVVRQTETASIKAHSANKTGPFTRELSALYTRATLEAAESLGGDFEGKARLNSYLMCIVEEPVFSSKLKGTNAAKAGKCIGPQSIEDSSSTKGYDARFGIVAVETATGDVMFGSFMDTVARSELEACIVSCFPAEMLLASPLSSATEKLLVEYTGPASGIRVERTSSETIKAGALTEVVSFYGNNAVEELIGGNPDRQGTCLQDYEGRDENIEAVMAMPEIVVQALALTLRYLRQFKLEKVLQLGATFRPFATKQEMDLSANTLRQLEILSNNADGTEKGSLLWLMDHTHTAFGARLLRYWITHPLRDHTLITARLNAVSEIVESMGSNRSEEGSFPGSGRGGGLAGATCRGLNKEVNGLLASVLQSLGKMPDIERGITRIFHRTATSSEFVSVMQSINTTSRNLMRFQLRSEETQRDVPDTGDKFGIKCGLLKRLVVAAASPIVIEHSTKLLSALDINAAAAGDKLNLFPGSQYPEVVRCREAVKVAEKQLDDYLLHFQKILRLPYLQYLSVSGVSYLIEVPTAHRVPSDWIKVSSTKKTNRYHPPEVLETLDALGLAKEEMSAACNKAWESFLTEFTSCYLDFRAAVQAIAALDCLYSLAIVSCNLGYTQPEFAMEGDTCELKIEAGRHPVLESTLQGGFVSNDTHLYGEGEHCQIITGPNMGGKSCYIRQVALIVIMAQIGCYVPASFAKLHVFDSVHTRMGASDSIQHGSSTFFEELSEASLILEKSTSRSLVIMDELGRGTSTHDGVAIAYATLYYLLKEIKCFTLFVTHYPKIAGLVKEFPSKVSPYHVSYLTEGKDSSKKAHSNSSEDQESAHFSQKVTFLYKLIPGVAGRSFGLHVARAAEIPEACIVHAAEMAAKMESEVRNRLGKRSMVEEMCQEGASLSCTTSTKELIESIIPDVGRNDSNENLNTLLLIESTLKMIVRGDNLSIWMDAQKIIKEKLIHVVNLYRT